MCEKYQPLPVQTTSSSNRWRAIKLHFQFDLHVAMINDVKNGIQWHATIINELFLTIYC